MTLTDRDDRPLDWLALCRAASTQGGLDMPVRLHKQTRAPGGRRAGRADSFEAPGFEPTDMRLVFIAHPPGDRLPARDPRLARAWLHAHPLVALPTEQIVATDDAVPP